jgi:hypothetical protein
MVHYNGQKLSDELRSKQEISPIKKSKMKSRDEYENIDDDSSDEGSRKHHI